MRRGVCVCDEMKRAGVCVCVCGHDFGYVSGSSVYVLDVCIYTHVVFVLFGVELTQPPWIEFQCATNSRNLYSMLCLHDKKKRIVPKRGGVGKRSCREDSRNVLSIWYYWHTNRSCFEKLVQGVRSRVLYLSKNMVRCIFLQCCCCCSAVVCGTCG